MTQPRLFLGASAFCVIVSLCLARPIAQAQAQSQDENLAGLAAGAIVLQGATSTGSAAPAWFMLDEDATTGWTSDPGSHLEPTVIELADRSTIRSVQFDTASIETDGREPKEVLVEISDTSATDGFKPLLRATLTAAPKDGQRFKAAAEMSGRWLRLSIKTMQQPTHDIAQIMEFRAFGTRLTHNPSPDVTGTYELDGSEYHLKQTGLMVSGCFYNGTKPIEGGLEGRLLRFTWNTEDDNGPAIAVFGSTGQMFVGHWRTDSAVTEHPVMQAFEAKKKSASPGSCPQWKGTGDALAAELKKEGRVRLYGINFDSDADTIRPESKPTLDRVAAILKADAALKITIEGHTDSTSTAEHNQQLSQRRATAVKQYLTTAGIQGDRLEAAGFGATRPVATNSTPLGRAANRRVELVRR